MKKIYKALADFQNEVPPIHKGTEGYGYSYADLPAIFEVINPLLKKYGLGFTQMIEGSALKTIIFHVESGESLESSADIPLNVQLAKMNPYQVMGSAITYFRRYTLSAMLGLITDKDNDAQGQIATLDDASAFMQQSPKGKPYPTEAQIKKLLDKAEKEGSVKVIEEAKKHFRFPAGLEDRLNDISAF